MRFASVLAATTILAAPMTGGLVSPALAQPASSADIAAQTRTLHNDLYAYSQAIIAAIKAMPPPAAPADPSARLDAIHADLQALLAQLKAAPVTTGPPPATGTPTASAPAADPYFPASAADALFPSPENSRQLRQADGSVGGKPYLLDKSATPYTLVPVSPKFPAGLSINGNAPNVCCGVVYNGAIVRQGGVYMQAAGGQWGNFNPSTGSTYNASLPDAAIPGSSTPASSAPAVPTLPAPYAVAPGSSGHVLTVGAAAGQFATFTAALAASTDGDTIEVGTTQVHEDIPLIAHSVRIHGGSYDCHDTQLAQGKGCLVNQVDVIYDGVTVTGAGINEGAAGGTAGIRPAGTSYVTVLNSTLSKNQNGIAGGGFPWVLAVQDTTLDGNGLGDGYTHNLYASTGTVRVTLTRVVSSNPNGGHDIKSRAPLFTATGCTFSGNETQIDLPDGTATPAVVTGTILAKNPGAANHRIIGYAEESQANGTAGMVISGGTITGGDTPFIQGAGIITFDKTTPPAFVGTKPTGAGITFVGL